MTEQIMFLLIGFVLGIIITTLFRFANGPKTVFVSKPRPNDDPKPGEVWGEKDESPWPMTTGDTVKILACEKGWVRYARYNSAGSLLLPDWRREIDHLKKDFRRIDA